MVNDSVIQAMASISMPSLNNIRQQEAIRSFVRPGGIERRGKGSHRIVNLNGRNLSIPHGIVKEPLLKHLIKMANVSEEDFIGSL